MHLFADTLKWRVLVVGVLIAGALTGGAFGAYQWYASPAQVADASYQTPEEADAYVRFDMEIFDIITREYWQAADEGELAELYRLALMKARGTTEEILLSPDRAGTAKMLAAAINGTSAENLKNLAVDLGIIVLANLAPQGRNGLLSEKDEQTFRDNANNVDRSRDLYETLGVESGAPVAAVAEAFEEKKAALEKEGTPEAETRLAEAEYAKSVLTNETTKVVYDEAKIEPSLVSRVMGGTLYINLSQVTPGTFNEFIGTLEKTARMPELTSLILDLRGNIGGTLDFAKYLLALFVGPNQYAFDLLRHGELIVERTPAIARIPALETFKEIAILTDEMTQSTAELTASMLKRRNLARVVGTKTRGWGSVENTYPIKTEIAEGEKYSVLLVNSLTLREDNEPIETRGVDPDIDVSAPDWREKLRSELRSSSLIRAIQELIR